MNKAILSALWLYIIAIVVSPYNKVYAQLSSEVPLPPQEAFIFKAEQNNQGIYVHFIIAKGYYLYKEKFDFLINRQDVQIGQPIYPLAQKKYDKAFNKDVEYYANKVSIILPTQSKESFKLKIKAQGCFEKAGICYQPMEYLYVANAAQAQDKDAQSNIKKTPLIVQPQFSFLQKKNSIKENTAISGRVVTQDDNDGVNVDFNANSKMEKNNKPFIVNNMPALANNTTNTPSYFSQDENGKSNIHLNTPAPYAAYSPDAKKYLDANGINHQQRYHKFYWLFLMLAMVGMVIICRLPVDDQLE